jgi:hypothetical protein
VGHAVGRGFLLGFAPFGLLSRGSEIDNVAHQIARRYPDKSARAVLARFGCKFIRRYSGTGSRQLRVYETLMRDFWSRPKPIRFVRQRNLNCVEEFSSAEAHLILHEYLQWLDIL